MNKLNQYALIAAAMVAQSPAIIDLKPSSEGFYKQSKWSGRSHTGSHKSLDVKASRKAAKQARKQRKVNRK